MLLELARAGSLPRMRLTGILVGLGSFLPDMKNCRIVRLDGDGELGPSFEAVRKHLRSSRARRQLVGAINDPSALGALRAFQEAGRSECCAVMGHNASPEGRAELRQPETRLLGSVAFFPERYGGGFVRVVVGIFIPRPVPPPLVFLGQINSPPPGVFFFPHDKY